MARAVAEIENEIRELSLAETKQLLRTLLEEPDGPADPDVERAWLEGVQRRSSELDARTVKPIPADEVFARARDQLKRR